MLMLPVRILLQDEDLAPMRIPSLGPHYQLAWDEEDRLAAQNLPIPVMSSTMTTSPLQRSSQGANRALDYPKMGKAEAAFDTLQMKEDDLVVEDKGAGPLTERVVSALMAAREEGDAPIGFGVTAGPAGIGSRSQLPSVSVTPADAGPSTSSSEKPIGLGSLEEGIKRELQFIGLLQDKDVCPFRFAIRMLLCYKFFVVTDLC